MQYGDSWAFCTQWAYLISHTFATRTIPKDGFNIIDYEFYIRIHLEHVLSNVTAHLLVLNIEKT